MATDLKRIPLALAVLPQNLGEYSPFFATGYLRRCMASRRRQAVPLTCGRKQKAKKEAVRRLHKAPVAEATPTNA